MQRSTLFSNENYINEKKHQIGNVNLCLRVLKEGEGNKYAICVTYADSGSFVPVYLSESNPMYQGTYVFANDADYSKILAAMNGDTKNLMATLNSMSCKFQIYGKALSYPYEYVTQQNDTTSQPTRLGVN